MKYTPISISPEQAQFLETRKFQIDEDCAYLRISLWTGTKKAMGNGMILDSPTIFGMSGNSNLLKFRKWIVSYFGSRSAS